MFKEQFSDHLQFTHYYSVCGGCQTWMHWINLLLPNSCEITPHWIAQTKGCWLSSWTVCHLGAERQAWLIQRKFFCKHQCQNNIHCWFPSSFYPLHKWHSKREGEGWKYMIKMPRGSLGVNYIQGKKKSNIFVAWFLWKIHSKPELFNIWMNWGMERLSSERGFPLSNLTPAVTVFIMTLKQRRREKMWKKRWDAVNTLNHISLICQNQNRKCNFFFFLPFILFLLWSIFMVKLIISWIQQI